MSAWKIILRGIRFYWRTHLGVILGSALATMVLTGSLLVGDSVKGTLRKQAELRVGKAEEAVISGDRFFREALAEDANAAPVLLLRGSMTTADAGARLNSVQVLGIDNHFWKLSPSGRGRTIRPGEIAVNRRVAEQLSISENDTVILRIEKPSAFSRDAPLSGEENQVVAIRARVAATIDDVNYGRFSLQANQVGAASAFLDLHFLQEKLGVKGRVNLLLQPSTERSTAASAGSPGSLLHDVIEREWRLDDAALQLRKTPTREVELRTDRIFLDPLIVEAAPRGTDALTYLVNEIRAGEKMTPYSMVTAVDASSSGFLPAELADDEIAISEWLAEDLGIREGATLRLSYFVMGERRKLEERSRQFTVLAVVPMDEPRLNGSWMPDFPGLADVQNCREWEPGFDMDVTKIRDKDEEYWDRYRGTPKAFVNIAVGQEMWGNRWGSLTSIRYPEGTDEKMITAALRAQLTPEQIGMNFLALRRDALAATRAPVDFGELFASFSFFLIGAAAVLTALLFVFSIEQRQEEAGLLLALGWPSKRVARLFRNEGFLLAVAGSVLGTAAALFYTRLVLRGLATIWRGAVGAVEFVFVPSGISLLVGAASGLILAAAAMWFAARRQFRHSARELLSGGLEHGTPQDTTASQRSDRSRSPMRRWAMVGSIFILAASLLVSFSQGSVAFFGAGLLLLVAGSFVAYGWLRGSAAGRSELQGVSQLAVRNAARRRGRSMATITVLASGVFIVIAIDSFRQRSPGPEADRSSGTGGFALVGEASLPIYEDLNTRSGRESFALEDDVMRDVQIVPMRVRDGDDASCLNLNRALQPRLLGVNVSELERRKAFSAPGGRPLNWRLLEEISADGAVPAIVDQSTLQWALQKKIGDTLEYRDERGARFIVRLSASIAGSILQGQLVIGEKRFIEKFPSQAGYRFFLIDAPTARVAAVAEHLSRALQDHGMELTPASRRLAEFQAVENSYLSIFQVLGGLGWLLGTAGLGIVVGRNILERRREYGLLEAIGFRRKQLRRLIMTEHRWLVFAGLLIGTGSALLAILPAFRERAAHPPIAEMGLLLAGLAVGSLFWTWLAARIALRGSGIAALRSE
jgi:ABC-type lipoprotein release transport system permease subunit